MPPTGSPPAQPVQTARVRVARKHHGLVRLTHWINVPLLFGLIATGLAIYWAAPVFVHARDPVTGSRDYLLDAGLAIARLLHDRGGDPRAWIYDHLSIGTGQLARALRLHWALAYLLVLGSFVIPHVIMAIADGWDTLRSMVVGWSARVKESGHD